MRHSSCWWQAWVSVGAVVCQLPFFLSKGLSCCFCIFVLRAAGSFSTHLMSLASTDLFAASSLPRHSAFSFSAPVTGSLQVCLVFAPHRSLFPQLLRLRCPLLLHVFLGFLLLCSPPFASKVVSLPFFLFSPQSLGTFCPRSCHYFCHSLQ